MSDDRTPRFSASLLLDQLDAMRELFGASRVEDAIRALPDDVRREIGDLTYGGWCRVSTATAVKSEVARLVGDGPLALQRRVVEHGMEKTLHGAWRFFLAHCTDSWLLKFSPLVYSKAFDRGALTLERFNGGRAEFVLRGWPDIPEFDCVGLAAGIETFLMLARRDRPRVTWIRRGDEARFTALWTSGAAGR